MGDFLDSIDWAKAKLIAISAGGGFLTGLLVTLII